MKFAKNQGKQTLQSASKLKAATGPFKKTPKSKRNRDPFFKDVTSVESKLNKPQELVRNLIASNLVAETTPTKIKRRLSVPGNKNACETPLKKVKRQLPNSEGRIKPRRSLSGADDWLEIAVEQDEIELVLPTKMTNDEEKETSDENESLSTEIEEDEEKETSDEDESLSTEIEENEEKENESLSSEDPEQSEEENEGSDKIDDDGSPLETSDEEESPKRAGVPMFSGTSTLGPAAEKKGKKNKGGQSKLMQQLYEGDPEILGKLSHFEDKVKQLSAEGGKRGRSQRKLLERTLNKPVEEKTVEASVSDDVGVTDKNVKQKGGETSKKTRYVLFVGNLPYTIDQYRVSEHFKRAGKVVSVRIPVNKETNQSRGFAFVEFTNKESYEKALSMHHTFIDSRRINVLYTNSKEQAAKAPPAKKKGMKAKNLKLAAMRKQGLLAGSVKESQKRSARRAKKNKASVEG